MKLPRTAVTPASPYDRPLLSRSIRLSFGAVLAAALLISALSLIFGLRGQASDQIAPSPQLQALLVQAGGPIIIFSEFGLDADTIWAADPDDPTNRMQLGRIDHAHGYGIFPSLSPDGALIAYTVLPPATGAAELWVLDIASGATERLTKDIDLQRTPVWSPASDALVVRRSGQTGDGGSTLLLRVDLGGPEQLLAASDAGLFPIDFSPDGEWLYFASLSQSGTDLVRAAALGGGSPQVIAHLSDGVARDWHLSPDGTQLAYLGQTPLDGGYTFVAQVLDLDTGSAHSVGATASGQFNPVWDRVGGLTVGQLGGTTQGAPLRIAQNGVRAQAVSPLPSPVDGGFDVPLIWSPDGAHLALRSFAGSSTANPGASHIVVSGTDGQRHELSPISDSVVIGWLERSP